MSTFKKSLATVLAVASLMGVVSTAFISTEAYAGLTHNLSKYRGRLVR